MKIKKILFDLVGWILIGLTFLGFIIIYVGIGGRGRYRPGEEANWYFVGVGVVLMLPFVIYLIKSNLFINKITDENAERIRNLIANGDVITVDLDKLKIQSNSYKHEISVGSGYTQRNEHINVNHNVIQLEIPYQNKSIKFKMNIDMDPMKLKMHFAIKSKTELYIDPKNPDNYFLDLRFFER